MKRSIEVDNFTVELDTADSTDLNAGNAPPQPEVFVVKASLPHGFNDVQGHVLCKVGDELCYSYGPRRKVIVPVAFAFDGDKEWTPIDVFNRRWELAEFVIPLGQGGYEDEYGEWVTDGPEGLAFVPAKAVEERHAYYVRWIPTGYGPDEGYWKAKSEAFPCQWEDAVQIFEKKRRTSFSMDRAEVVSLPSGDCKFL